MPINSNDLPSVPLVSSVGNFNRTTIIEQVNAWLEGHPDATISISDGSIGSRKIAANAVTSSKIADDSITRSKMADGSVSTDELVDGSVATAKLADEAVTISKVKNGAIVTDKIANGAVTSDKLAPDAIPIMSTTRVGAAKVGPGLSVTDAGVLELDGSGDIATAVTNWLDAHPDATTTVLDGSITDAKLVQTGGVLEVVTGMSDDVVRLKDGMGNFWVESSAPIITIILGSGLNSITGGTSSRADRARSYSIIAVNRRAVMLTNNTYQIWVQGYSDLTISAENYVRKITPGWTDANIPIYIPEDIQYFAMMFKKVDETDFDPNDNDADNIKAALKFMVPTDRSLTMLNKAADAKSVGDSLTSISASIGHADSVIQDMWGAYYEMPDMPEYKIVIGSAINMNTGSPISNAARSRTYTISTIITGARSVCNVDTNLMIQVVGYDHSGVGATNFNRRITPGWIEAGEMIHIPNDIPFFAMMFKKVDESNFDPEGTDEQQIRDAVKFYGLLYEQDETKGLAYHTNDIVQLAPYVSDVIDLYDGLLSAYSGYVTKTPLSYGVKTLYEYKFTTGDYNDNTGRRGRDDVFKKPVILITGGLHGDEKTSVMGLYTVCKALCESQRLRSQLGESLTIKVIPVVNISGYDANTRLDAAGVNINRNFDSSTWELTDPGSGYSGEYPASEDETKIVQAWMDANTDAILYMDSHNSAWDEVAMILTIINDAEEQQLKMAWLRQIDKVIPHWKHDRQISDNNIMAYTGTSANTGTSTSYANDKGILAMTLETCWNIDSRGKHGTFSIGTAAESIGNSLIGVYKMFDSE